MQHNQTVGHSLKINTGIKAGEDLPPIIRKSKDHDLKSNILERKIDDF